MQLQNKFTEQAKIQYPIIGGAMYPCSNPELVAAVSAAGGIGIIQPVSLVFAHKYDFTQGLKYIKSLTNNPVGMNIITEKSSKTYQDRMKKWLDIALEEGVRFFVTSLGSPKWVVERVTSVGGIVYHDVTEKKWAEKALSDGVHGLICVNNRAGGHAGQRSTTDLFQELSSFGVPLICAGGVGDGVEFKKALDVGYLGVQLGTRFIASLECSSHQDYKMAIINAEEEDIVLTDKISGVPVSVIKTPYIEKIGTQAGPFARYMLKHPKFKHYMRMFYTLQSAWKLKEAAHHGAGYQDYWQAGKSVAGCHSVLPVRDIIQGMVEGK